MRGSESVESVIKLIDETFERLQTEVAGSDVIESKQTGSDVIESKQTGSEASTATQSTIVTTSQKSTFSSSSYVSQKQVRNYKCGSWP